MLTNYLTHACIILLFKQFAYLKQMHAAATVIQRGYRAMRARRMATTPIK